MANEITFMIDGLELTASPGQTIIEAADEAGIYIPRLCHKDGLEPFGGCRVCTVLVNGRPCAACTQPVAPGIIVESESEAVHAIRKDIIEMLFVEGNHFCMFCEKSGNCELQALAYRFQIAAPRFEYFWPQRELDMSHPDIYIDQNRCVLCARCVRTSKDIDGKHVFQFVGRGPHKKLAVNAEADLSGTNIDATDQAIDACPVGALMKKRIGYARPIGHRDYDHQPIGSDIQKSEPAQS